MARRISFVACTFVLLLCTAPLFAQSRQRDATLPQEQFKSGELVLSAFRSVVKATNQATVRVIQDDDQVALGTIVSADGWILTKASELLPEQAIKCELHNGRKYHAMIVGVARSVDLAMLKIKAKGLTPIKWAAHNNGAQVGQWVATSDTGKDAVAVGVVSIPQRRIARIPPIIGVSLRQDESGPMVVQVHPKTGAAKAHIEIGDVITHAAGEKTKSREQLINVLAEFEVGQIVKLRLRREGKSIEVGVKLGRRSALLPENQMQVQNKLGGRLSKRRDGFSAVIQHDTVLRPQDCGGPLVTIDGQVVGINIARAGRISSYALPAYVVKPLIKGLKSGKLVPKKPVNKNAGKDADKDAK